MKVITSHERTDMDALAAIYAASLLYPDYEPVLPSKLNRNVRDLVTLFRDELPFLARRTLTHRRITHLLLVDTQGIAPLRGSDEHTLIHIIDHHPQEQTLPANATFEGSEVGATTTLLTARIREREIPLSRVGASLMLMGIYEDTGSLSYLTTTEQDAEAAAWLLGQGADVALVGEFLSRPLTAEQRRVLAKLVASTAIESINGRTIAIASVLLDRYVDELSSLIHQIMDTFEPEACILLAQFEDDVQLIARSATDAVDVAQLLRPLGGGGHSKAAAALVEHSDLAQVQSTLRTALQEQVSAPVSVRQIMSTNVHTLKADMLVRDAANLMRRYGHEGFPVLDGERLVGVLTRRDIDRAIHHHLGELPVRNYIYTGAVYVHPDDPVDKVQHVMLEHDLGQVPVVLGGRFVGIVTRTDLIKLWTPALYPPRAEQVRRMMEKTLPPALETLLLRARDTANDLGYALYIVGGFVRDLLLGAPTLDLDLVVEGDAIRMAQQLSKALGARTISHARFGTAKLLLPEPREPGIPAALDFVTARTEFYERPSVLPEVERSSIKQDLYRRDFTINTLAICLDRGRYGELLDYYGGERDIQEKRIRVLHNLSFVEDPTRILRAVRFEQRLGFTIEERTAELIEDALDLLDNVTGERLRHELYLLLEEAAPERALERLDYLGVLAHLHPRLMFTRGMAQLFVRMRQRVADVLNRDPGPDRETDSADSEEEAHAPMLSLCYLALLTSGLKPDELDELAAHLRLRSRDTHFLHEVLRLRELLTSLGATSMLPSSLYRLLEPFSREARFVLSVLTDSARVRQRLDAYERTLSRVQPRVNGEYLRKLGLPPGPIYGEILLRVRDAVLDQQVTSLEAECALAQSLARYALNDAAAGAAANDT